MPMWCAIHQLFDAGCGEYRYEADLDIDVQQAVTDAETLGTTGDQTLTNPYSIRLEIHKSASPRSISDSRLLIDD